MLTVVVVRRRKADGKRQTPPINQQMVLAARLGAVGGVGADAFPAEGGKERSKRQDCSVASRFARRVVAVEGCAGANVPRPRRLAIPASAASKSSRYHSAFPAAGLPIGCRSSGRTGCPSGRRGRVPAAGRPIPMLRVRAVTVQSAPITRQIPRPEPFSPPTKTITDLLSGNHQTIRFARTVLIDALSQTRAISQVSATIRDPVRGWLKLQPFYTFVPH